MAYEPKTEPEFLKIQEVADKLSVSRATIDRWHRSDPSFPRKIAFGGNCARFRRQDFEEWVARAEQRSIRNG